MSRKIMILCGSPRVHGNTNTVAGWFAEGAAAAGAEVQTVDLAALRPQPSGCTCCMGCQRQEAYECVIKDAAQPILAAMPAADVLVFATPVYTFGPTAQMKLVLDRMYSLFKFREGEANSPCAIARIPMVLISTAADGLAGGLDLTRDAFAKLAGFTGGRFESLLVPHAPKDPKVLAQDEPLRQKAIAFGRQVAVAPSQGP